MELREIEIFLILAEELHFGRAAERLYVSQARVSQAISQQERHLGGALFDRSNRRQIRLTPLGRQLRDDLRPIYAGPLLGHLPHPSSTVEASTHVDLPGAGQRLSTRPRRVNARPSAVEFAEQALRATVPRDAPRHKIRDGRRGLDPITHRLSRPSSRYARFCRLATGSCGAVVRSSPSGHKIHRRGPAVGLYCLRCVTACCLRCRCTRFRGP